MSRRKPVRHPVRGYRRGDGTGVRQHEKGSGIRENKPSRVVGRPSPRMEELYKKSTEIELHGHVEDVIKLFKELGFGVRSLTLEEMHGFYVGYDPDTLYENQKREMVGSVRVGARNNAVVLSKAGEPVKVVDLVFP